MSNLMKIHLVGAEMLHAYTQTDRQTDMQQSCRFLQFCEHIWKRLHTEKSYWTHETNQQEWSLLSNILSSARYGFFKVVLRI